MRFGERVDSGGDDFWELELLIIHTPTMLAPTAKKPLTHLTLIHRKLGDPRIIEHVLRPGLFEAVQGL